MNRQLWIRKTTGALLCAGAVALVGCNSNQPPASSAAAASSTAAAPATADSSAQASAPYTPPSADQLYQMVAPIALFPDKLIAQVLAGSTYPDQITSADNVLTQNPNLKGADLQTAIAPQSWDPSVKGLTAFPSVLDQMASNISWTTALGDAYVNDPTDVMNAIQVMRQRASQHGNLRSSAQMRVVTQAEPAEPTSYSSDNENGDPVYSGPAVVSAPPQVIEIEAAQPDTVYVPQYDAQTAYGDQVPYYPGYTYERPRQYSTGQLVTAGAITFGVGVLVGALFEHHQDQARSNYGWQSWGMNWGNRGRGGNSDGENGDRRQRPTVIHNNTSYVSRSTTVVNHYVTNNINNSRNVTYNHSNVNSNVNSNNQHNTTTNDRPNDKRGSAAPQPVAMRATERQPVIAHAPLPVERRPMSMPNFGKPAGRALEPHGAPIVQRPAPMPTPKHGVVLNPGERLPINTRSPYAMHTSAPAEHARPSTRPTIAPVMQHDAPVRAVEPRAMPHAQPAPRAEPVHSIQREAPIRAVQSTVLQQTRPASRAEPMHPVAHEQTQRVQHESARPVSAPQAQRKAEQQKKDEKKKEEEH